MSNYNSEHGSFRLTKTGYQQMIRAIRTAYNTYYANAFAVAEVAYKYLSAIKGRDALKRQREMFQGWNEEHCLRMPARLALLDNYTINIIERELFRGKDGSLTKPRKAGFPKFINTLQEFTVQICDGAGLSFHLNSDGSGYTHWQISENNRAVEETRGTASYKVLMDVLRAYKWKRNEGGCWHYMDEYERHYAQEDGRESRSEISAAWGALGQQEKEDRLTAHLARFDRARRSSRSKKRN
jgi:hypothetical protein